MNAREINKICEKVAEGFDTVYLGCLTADKVAYLLEKTRISLALWVFNNLSQDDMELMGHWVYFAEKIRLLNLF